MIRGLLFDFDGLILDTELPQYQAWQEIYQDHGCDLPLHEWAVILGSSNEAFNPITYLEKQLNCEIDREDAISRRNARCKELLGLQSLLPGITDYLSAARDLGLKLAIASSSDREWVVGHLTRLGIHHSFDAILTADDVTRVKPDPMLFEAALNALHLRPEEGVVFEDSPNGILAAKKARVFCVAVPNDLTKHLDLGLADLRIQSLADVPLPDLLNRIESMDGHHQ